MLVPERVAEACNHVPYRETEEREANLPEIETVVVAEHQWESTESEVKDSLEERGVGAENHDHGIEEQKLEWDVERLEESLGERLGCASFLGGRVVFTVVFAFAEGHRLSAEEDGVERFWNEEDASEGN